MTPKRAIPDPRSPRPRGLALVSLAVGAGLVLAACGEGESPVFDPGSGRTLDAPLDTLAALSISADRGFRPVLETGSRPGLLLLREPDAYSTVYLEFDLGSLPDTGAISEGRLSFRISGGSGDPVRMELFEIDPAAPAWTEEEVPLDGLPLLVPSLDLQVSPVIGLADTIRTASDVLRVPGELLERWRSEPEANRGVALRLSESSRGFLVLLSSEAVYSELDSTDVTVSVNTPELRVVGLDFTVRIEPTDDAYHVEDRRPPEAPDAETIFVDQLIPHRALLLPELGTTPLRAGDSVHRAELFLHVLEGSVAPDDSFTVGLYGNLGPWTEAEEPDSVAREAFAVDVATITDETESLRLDFAPLAQRWVDGEENYGLSLRVIGEGQGASSLRLFSREAETDVAPWIRIVYSPSPDARWEGRDRP